jgi:hypothetical protein
MNYHPELDLGSKKLFVAPDEILLLTNAVNCLKFLRFSRFF